MRARLIAGLLRLFAALPWTVNRAMGTALGWTLAHIPSPLRSHAAINLRLCLPELTPAEQRRLLRISLIETGKTVLEAGPLWFWPIERIRALMGEASNLEPVEAAVRAGRGVILATPHLGSWEMAGHFCAVHWGATILYRPPRLRALDALLCHSRERLGARMAPTSAKGVRSLYETLARGGVVGMLPDQDPGQGGGVFAPFFGVSANSMVLLGRLARKTGAAVFFGFCERLPGTRGYRFHFLPAPEGIDDPDPQVAATAMNRGVEACVRALPEQYQWSYRRFRSRPAGEARIY